MTVTKITNINLLTPETPLNHVDRELVIDWKVAQNGGVLECFHPSCDKSLLRLDVTFDHWIPTARGGSNKLGNIELMHKRCNAVKSDVMPNEDGTLPLAARRLTRQERRDGRPTYCDLCESGRILLIGETCELCGSGPQPAVAPKALQVQPKECDHDTNHCWMCFLGFVERKSALESILMG